MDKSYFTIVEVTDCDWWIEMILENSIVLIIICHFNSYY